MRGSRVAATVAASLLVTGIAAGTAAALPQQQGSVDLVNQFDGQWDGPVLAQGSSGAGSSVAALPDLFRTGRSAVAIGAPQASPAGRVDGGSVYVVAGQRGTGTVDLTALAGRGYRLDGPAGGQLGFSLAPLTLRGGDPGLAIGAPYVTVHGHSEAGEVFIIDLRRLRHSLDLSGALARAVVAVVTGSSPCTEAGYALAASGPAGTAAGRHATGDDLIVGAPGTDAGGCPVSKPGGVAGGNTGAAFVVPASRLHGRVDLGGGGLRSFVGSAPGSRAGSAVAWVPATAPVAGIAGGSAGMRRGWWLIGAPSASPAGRASAGAAYLVPRGPGGTVSLGSPPAGSTTFEGAAANDALGSSVTSTIDFAAGPVRGVVDVVLGAPQASPAGLSEAGSVFVIPDSGLSALVDLASPGAAAGRFDGADAGDEAGFSIAGAGDLNGDRRGDLAIGAPFVGSQTGTDRIDNGAVYVVYGGSGGLGGKLGTLRSRGYTVFGARNSDEAGTAIAGAPDENGDGRPDLLVGAPFALDPFAPVPGDGGAVYTVFGFGTPVLAYPGGPSRVLRVGRFVSLRPVSRATGGTRFSVAPSLPPGLSLDPRTGRIAGRPRRVSATGVYTVTVTDLAGVGSAALSLRVVR